MFKQYENFHSSATIYYDYDMQTRRILRAHALAVLRLTSFWFENAHFSNTRCAHIQLLCCCYENHRLWWLNSDENRGKILPIMRMEDMHVFSQYQRTVFAICVMIELFVFRQPHCRNKNYSFCVIQRDTRLLHINWTNVFTCTRMVREPTHCTWAYCEVMSEWTWLRHSKLSRQRYKCECHQHNINQ